MKIVTVPNWCLSLLLFCPCSFLSSLVIFSFFKMLSMLNELALDDRGEDAVDDDDKSIVDV